MEPIADVDCLIVGAGFGGIVLLHKLLDIGFSVKIYEKASSIGGIWYWNCYPGSRVDTDAPIYQIHEKELWEGFTFNEKYAGWKELRRYFEHVDQKWNVSQHIELDKDVQGVKFDEMRRMWYVRCADGTATWCRYFLPCVGFVSKTYTPQFPGLGSFEGPTYHTGVWPQEGVDFCGKRVAQIGTGASGVQVIQEIGNLCKHLTIYQRTPNYCLPMNQVDLDPIEEQKKKDSGFYEESMEKTRHTFSGFTYEWIDKETMDDEPEERNQFYHTLMNVNGGFHFWLATYKDMLFVQEANDEAYKFWRDTVRKRITDPIKQELLAPTVPVHPWGTKRPSLESRFYEVVDQPHVSIIDVNESPILAITPKGVCTKKEGVVEVDILIFATGFDSLTGSLKQMNVRNAVNMSVGEYWESGVRTATGIAIHGFPNMFFLYGPQAPTAFANGPACIQYQTEWIAKVLARARQEGIDRIEATQTHEDQWVRRVRETWAATLFPKARSWYQGYNIPGKRVEALNWSGGLPAYLDALDESLENDLQGWLTCENKSQFL